MTRYRIEVIQVCLSYTLVEISYVCDNHKVVVITITTIISIITTIITIINITSSPSLTSPSLPSSLPLSPLHHNTTPPLSLLPSNRHHHHLPLVSNLPTRCFRSRNNEKFFSCFGVIDCHCCFIVTYSFL
mgnify:CR=1 FL=1